MVTRTAPSLVAKRRATLRTDAPSTAIARTILRWLMGNTARCRSTSHIERLASSAGDATISSQSSRASTLFQGNAAAAPPAPKARNVVLVHGLFADEIGRAH